MRIHELGATSLAVFTEPLFMIMGASESSSGGMENVTHGAASHGIRIRTRYADNQLSLHKKTTCQILSI